MGEKREVEDIPRSERRRWEEESSKALEGVKNPKARELHKKYLGRGLSITPKQERDEDFKELTGRRVPEEEED